MNEKESKWWKDETIIWIHTGSEGLNRHFQPSALCLLQGLCREQWVRLCYMLIPQAGLWAIRGVLVVKFFPLLNLWYLRNAGSSELRAPVCSCVRVAHISALPTSFPARPVSPSLDDFSCTSLSLTFLLLRESFVEL